MEAHSLGAPHFRAGETVPSSFSTTPDSSLDSALVDDTLDQGHHLSRWIGWRLRLLVVAALIGCVALLMTARWLASLPQIDAQWRAGPQGQMELIASSEPALVPQVGRSLIGVIGGGSTMVMVDSQALHRSARWTLNDQDRAKQLAMHQQLAAASAQGTLRLFFSQGTAVPPQVLLPPAGGAPGADRLGARSEGGLALVQAVPRSLAGLGAMFWLLSWLALALYLVAMVVVLARPSTRNLLYAVMAVCQAGNLGLMAIEWAVPIGMPQPLLGWNLPLHAAFDLIAAAALVHIAAVHPRQLPGCGSIAGAAWAVSLLLVLLLSQAVLPGPWWWLQGAVAVMCTCAIGLLSWSYRLEPHPFAVVMRRFGIVALSTWLLLSVALLAVQDIPSLQPQVAVVGPLIWYVFMALLLLLTPFLSKSQQVMREFSLLAGISTVATSLDLLFVAVFSLGQFASLTLALFLSLGLYTGVRQWLLNRLYNQNVLTTERMFEKLYRIAREVEAHPERVAGLMTQLLRDLFEPLEASVIDKPVVATRVLGGGSTLAVPVPELALDGLQGGAATIVVRFAHRGRRLFTSEDARLSERIVEQLRRAVAFDKAVEQGRNEERLRLAQDLHDDIGARLLTLMYKAQSPEMEDYVRHTLQDLKTLTRGLAAPNHPLSHAAAEWKADITQRLTAAQVALSWSFSADRDLSLSVVQWSALTRVLRELVNNVIAHSQARRVDIEFELAGDRLDFTVTDNGTGRNPRAWSHGLGLGGVRKRVKQLGGEVEWREAPGGGICCQVSIRQLSDRPERPERV